MSIPTRYCTICLELGDKVPAVFVGTNMEGGQWYECDGHGAGHHAKVFGGGMMRLRRQTLADFFNLVREIRQERQGTAKESR